jgi:hypothetical protein
VRWQADPGLETFWRGKSGNQAEAGYNMLQYQPAGVPQEMPCNKEAFSADDIKALGSHRMTTIMKEQGLDACVAWNMECAKTGRVPVAEYLEDTTPLGEWGRLCNIGAVPENMAQMRHVEKFWHTPTREGMFALPEGPNGELAANNVHHVSHDAALVAMRNLPLVRKKGEKLHDCAMAEHPQNVTHPAVVRRRGGDWGEKAPGDNCYFFNVDLAGAVKGEYCVLAQQYTDHGLGISCGKIESIDTEAKTLHLRTLKCDKPPHKEECLKGVWHSMARESKAFDHFSVVVYFKYLTKAGKLPKKAQDAASKKITWGQESQVNLDAEENSGSEEESDCE